MKSKPNSHKNNFSHKSTQIDAAILADLVRQVFIIFYHWALLIRAIQGLLYCVVL